MSRRFYRFFSGFINMQEKWLNRMAESGLRLVNTGKAHYDFEETASRYVYAVEFIGNKSKDGAREYKAFLEDCGYRVFFKNINLSYSVGKVRLRPWADKGGRISTGSTTYNRELLIVEKPDDGKAFQLHSTFDDRLRYTRLLQRPYLFLLIMCIVMLFVLPHIVWAIFGVFSLLPVLMYQREIMQLKKQKDISE